VRMQIPSRVNLIGPGSNATNKSCETLRLRGECRIPSCLWCQNRHISDALLNIKSNGGCMPYLRFAAAVPRIKHTNARPVQSNEEQMLHTCKLVESLRLSLFEKTTARLLRWEILRCIYSSLSIYIYIFVSTNNFFILIKKKYSLFAIYIVK